MWHVGIASIATVTSRAMVVCEASSMVVAPCDSIHGEASRRRLWWSKCYNRTTVKAEEGEPLLKSNVKKRNRVSAKNPIAIKKSNLMNQLCCQNVYSNFVFLIECSLCSTLLEPGLDDDDEDYFLRVTACGSDDATVDLESFQI